MASGRPPPPSPGLRMKAEIQLFSPKDKSLKVRGQGSGALDRHRGGRRNLQFYHHGKHSVSSMQLSEPSLVNLQAVGLRSYPSPCAKQPLLDRRDMRASTYYNPAFRLGKGQLHSYSPKHTVPFSMLTLGQTSHWTFARLWKHI